MPRDDHSPVQVLISRRPIGISKYAFAQESANYAKMRRSTSKFVLYRALDRFSRRPLKYHAARFTAVQPCQAFRVFQAGKIDRSRNRGVSREWS